MNIALRNFYPVRSLRRSPLDTSLDRLVGGMFDDFFAPARSDADKQISAPRVNLKETEKSFEIEAELPGVQKDDVKISVDGKRVSIEAEIRSSSEKKDGETVLYSERFEKRFARSFTLPAEVDDSQAQAKLDNGVLTLSLPKKQAAQAKRITIQ